MLNSTTRTFRGMVSAVALLVLGAPMALAGPLMDRIEAGEPIRIGFANEAPFAYPGENGEPMGFVNAYVLGLLEKMGYDNVTPVVTDWGGLIPGLNANRLDIVTGGLNITGSRCENIAFSEPMLQAGDAFIVPAGNPKGINNYQDLIEQNAIFVTGAGYNTGEIARREGVPDANVMQVPGNSEILAALLAGRADAGGVTYFTAVEMTEGRDDLEVSDISQLPDWTMNWASIGFRNSDQDFVDAFNVAQQDYLGSDEMMAAVAEYGYGPENLPTGQTAEWVCANR